MAEGRRAVTGLVELSQRHARLREIGGIMTAMKSLSLLETRKLAQLIGHQQRMRANIESAAADFLQFHPDFIRDATRSTSILVLIGSERGFCGNFNERIVHALDRLAPERDFASLVVIGRRLASRLATHAGVSVRLDGATVTEDIPAVLDRLADALQELRPAIAVARPGLLCLRHDPHGEPSLIRLLPLPSQQPRKRLATAPLLQLSPAAFFAGLLDQFLMAALHGQLYGSLAAENHQRLAHMERALDKLNETLARLALRRNALRQERIVEEIEVMLSTELALEDHSPLARTTAGIT